MARRLVVACGALRPELEAARAEIAAEGVEVDYLDQDLHRSPEKLKKTLRDYLDGVDPGYDTIVLGYGLCSNALDGITAPPAGLIIPRAHDCITLFLGARDRYDRAFHDQPGTYYLTPGWLELNRDPLGIVETDYAERVGYEEGLACMREELAHYPRFALIDTGARPLESLMTRAEENARVFEKDLVIMSGDPAFFQRLLAGPADSGDFFQVAGGERVRQTHFF